MIQERARLCGQARARSTADDSDGIKRGLERDLRRVQVEIEKLIGAVAREVLSDDDARDQISRRKMEADDLGRRIAALRPQLDIPVVGLTDQKIRAFGLALGHVLRAGTIKQRQAYLRLFVNRIEVGGGEMRICGPEDLFPAAIAQGQKLRGGGVNRFAQEWRPISDESVNRLNLTLQLAA